MSHFSKYLPTFKNQGYIHLSSEDKDINLIDTFEGIGTISHIRRLAIELKKQYAPLEGHPRRNGSGKFWKGLEMASTLNPKLFEFYTSNIMFEVASTFLEMENPFIFNDQIVVKLPNETFSFDPHFDNQFGIDPEAALRGDFKTINCCVILTDTTLETGPLECQNPITKEWETIIAKSGDIIIIDGNTIHKSSKNNSDKIRALYACVYSSAPIGIFQQGYYNERFKKT